MNGMLLSLTGVMLFALTLQSAAADTRVPLSTEIDIITHAAVTDTPDIIDMSHADPKTWSRLLPTAQRSKWASTIEIKFSAARPLGEGSVWRYVKPAIKGLISVLVGVALVPTAILLVQLWQMTAAIDPIQNA